MRDIILMAMSTLNTIVSNDYRYEKEGIEIKDCRSQLEPVTRYYLTKCAGNDVTFIILATKATREEEKILDDPSIAQGIKTDISSSNNGEECKLFKGTAIEYFSQRIRKCEEIQKIKNYSDDLEKLKELIDLRVIDLSEENPEGAIGEAVDKIRKIRSEESGKLYVVTNGGFRDVSAIMNAISSLLVREKISVDEIFGTNTYTNCIINQKKSFDVFEFVSGMTNFLEFGNTDLLLKYYENRAVSESVKDVIKAMNEISLGTQLCDPTRYMDGLAKLGERLDILKKDTEAKDDLIKIFIHNIESDYGKLLHKGKWTIVDVIERCLNKKLYQQALTFLESQIPQYCYNHYIFYYDEECETDICNFKAKTSFNHKANVNYIFDTYIVKKCRYFRQNQNLENMYLNSKQAIEFLCGKLKEEQFLQYEKDENLPQLKLKLTDRKGNTLLLEIKTKCSKQNEEKLLGRFLRLHKGLKECRNKFNHGNSAERPLIEDIKTVIEEYIKTARKLERICEEVKEEN